jgi:hypothetical protein
MALVGSNRSLVLRQPAEHGGSASGGNLWRLDAKPKEARCKPSQARYGSKCYAGFAKVLLDCELDLGGEGSFDTLCRLQSSVSLGVNSFIIGAGALEIEHHVSLSYAAPGCEVVVLLAKSLVLAPGSAIRHMIALPTAHHQHSSSLYWLQMLASGDNLGCQQNTGAACTRFDVVSHTLAVSNKNKASKTDTVLLAFPVRPLWGSMLVEELARIGVPLHWSTIRV